MLDEYLKNVSMRQLVTPDDVAATVAFLISDAGANLSGQSLAVDGNVERL
jgi:NAD(P)-dependent dehydrogenase (short-subunit alcohol dehydrogenase family)